MIKKTPIDQVKLGMFIHDLNVNWSDHPFMHNSFLVDKVDILDRIIGANVKEVYIDTALGADLAQTESNMVDSGETDELIDDPSSLVPEFILSLSPTEEFQHAKALYSNASKLMQEMMNDVRLGKQVALEQCEPIVDNIVESMFRFPSALLPLAQMKSRDEYTFQHSVSVSALAVAFGRVLNLPRDQIKEIALGGLLHDIGKALVPNHILNKPGKLNDAEFVVIKSHALHTAKLLNDVKGVSEITFNAAAQHHERYDGTGYPHGLKGDAISLHGQMLAIVDVYDAITSIRVYHKGMPPTETLKKMFEWSGTHFNPKLVQAFIKGIGIYPAGSLVRMESGKLGIVRAVATDNLLQPTVQLIYDSKKMSYIKPETVDLSVSNDKITSHESFEKWQIDPSKWATAHL